MSMASNKHDGTVTMMTCNIATWSERMFAMSAIWLAFSLVVIIQLASALIPLR